MKTVFFTLFTLLSTPCLSQNGLTQIGGRPAGMGYAYATESDAWSIYNNPAGLGELDEVTASFAYENKFAIPGLGIMGAGIIAKLPLGSLGVNVFKFGDKYYNEQSIATSYGNRFGIASLGIKLSMLQYNVEGFGSKTIYTLDFGGIATISDKLIFGAYIRNINQAEVSESGADHAPTLLNAGVSYRPSDRLHLNLEAEKDLDYDPTMRAGLEYLLYNKIALRAGINTVPFTNFAGLGFITNNLSLSYALTKEIALGYSHQGSLVYQLTRNE